MSHALDLESNSPETTQAIGWTLGAALRTGDVVALVGPLGAGKTVLVKGIAAGAGVNDPKRVTSPTFVIVNEHEGRLRLFHVDAYRLRDGRELEALGFREFLELGAVVVEWADRVDGALPAERLTITIEPVGASLRRLHLRGDDERARQLMQAVRADP
ncbi:MAG: tRNA (adenosine(37)-N6)-threonylcarbamoyltransferase complex ATPase subunit type 1 TsaE [Phycisphaerae bacterium]